MANLPYRYSQEAQDERDWKAERNPKSRVGWSYSDISEERWEEIFGKKEKDERRKFQRKS